MHKGECKMEEQVIIVPGLFGGLSYEHYRPIANLFKTENYNVVRPGRDWNPVGIAADIKQLSGHKTVVCLSLGAIIGDLLAGDENITVYYVCPYLGASFINRREKTYAHRLRRVFRTTASVLMKLVSPFKWHRWYPLFGGTKPDGWFLSAYAIFEQLWYAFRETPEFNLVDGTVLSLGDEVVEPREAAKTSKNVVKAWTVSGTAPSHVNLRREGEKFGRRASKTAREKAKMETKFKTLAELTRVLEPDPLSEDAKAYLSALSELIEKKSSASA